MITIEHRSPGITLATFNEPYEDKDIQTLTDCADRLNSAGAPYVLVMVNGTPTPDHWRKILALWYKREREPTNTHCRGMIRVQPSRSLVVTALEHAASHALAGFPLRTVTALAEALDLAAGWMGKTDGTPS